MSKTSFIKMSIQVSLQLVYLNLQLAEMSLQQCSQWKF